MYTLSLSMASGQPRRANAKVEGEAYVCDDDKYFWVQAESLAAAALLASRTGEAKYWDWYDRCGRTHGSISSTIVMVRGFASSTPTTASTTTRRVRPARPITTRWAPAMRCSMSCAPRRRDDTPIHSRRRGDPT
jgi:hypothetical protein